MVVGGGWWVVGGPRRLGLRPGLSRAITSWKMCPWPRTAGPAGRKRTVGPARGVRAVVAQVREGGGLSTLRVLGPPSPTLAASARKSLARPHSGRATSCPRFFSKKKSRTRKRRPRTSGQSQGRSCEFRARRALQPTSPTLAVRAGTSLARPLSAARRRTHSRDSTRALEN